ncbi:zinc finger protein 1 homolog isoform X1 [Sinocyclocheilus grahami]|uniref:Zinc finger protein 1 homolog n=2 Tax=Sinocyclocheilus grahami TaxID=75366 RepID=A0A672Q8F1_SINGR|nr:PREDICTED: zinc finger protein 1 homolog isoform X1 [Sinocyclocheilus grahami]XP_016095510.1 PREDICTED: zinc finger protein 1 homolog isoform X1 [Sinocyclocheilus grahami]
MSEVIHQFQSQLSGVMETVFKAAIFEITRLVEESFVKEVSRSREQVETLKKRLQWSETRRKNQETTVRSLRCAECDKARVCNEEKEEMPPQSENERSLKQEKVPDGNWGSCELESETLLGKERLEDQTSSSNTTEPASIENRKLDCVLKEESLYATAGNKELHDGWMLDTEGAETSDFSAHSYSEQELHQIQEEWSSGLDQTADNETYGDITDVQGLAYPARYDAEELASYSVHELEVGDLDGLGERTFDMLGNSVSVAVGPDQNDLDQEGGRRHSSSIKSKRGNGGSLPVQVSPQTEDVDRDMHCLLINADGHLQDINSFTEVRSGVAGGAGHRGHSLYVGDTSGAVYKGHALNHSLKPNVGQALGDSRASVNAFPPSHRVGLSAAYTCNQCGKKFTQACNLKVHQRVHQREGLHLCSHCGKGYSSFSDLRRHRCSQTGDKPYTCTLCGNKFSRLWNLKLHKRIHTQEKPHKCTMCSKSFTRADILKVHQRTHTGERPYCCGICGLSFKRLDHLRSHQRKHSADQNNP